jgi:acetylornithine deacetylase/succinyl-diaminopimelate desuccinylase-like protein
MTRPLAITVLLLCGFHGFVIVHVPAQERARTIGERLLQDPNLKGALDSIKRGEPRVIEDQVRLCEIPAPPFKEARRAEAMKQAFESLALANVRIDRIGNVIGERPGASARPNLVFSAHLDTVFPEETPVRTSRSGNIIKGPGISDDCRGLAVLLAVVRTLNEGQLQTEGTITFVATVGEEGLGDLRGVKQLFAEEPRGRIDRFVSVDGAGMGITHVGVGSIRYRAAYQGAGGHSYADFGVANPVHALGRAIAKIGDLRVPTAPRTTFNVGRIGGGTSVNSIATEAWMEVDLRSSDRAALTALDATFQKALDVALAEENGRWSNRGRLTLQKTIVGNRPAGQTPEDAAIVQAALSVTSALGLRASLDEGSTDANIAMSLGIPAITIDGGGSETGSHTPAETFDTTNSWQGTARAVLLAIALSGR